MDPIITKTNIDVWDDDAPTLKECKVCNGDDSLNFVTWNEEVQRWYHGATCFLCGFQVKGCESQTEANELWNQRNNEEIKENKNV